jgi:hypothetical protein
MSSIRLQTPALDVVLDPSRGGEFQRISRPGGSNVLAFHDWKSPLSADDGPVYGSTELDWLSRYRAGWQVLFPNAGAEGVVDGVPIAFHGETSQAHLEVLSTSGTECVLRAHARLPLELTRTVRLLPDSATVQVEETVVNVGSTKVPFVWGHHPTFPAITGARIDSPGRRTIVEPRTPGPLAPDEGLWPRLNRLDGAVEDVSAIPGSTQVRLLYLPDLVEGWVALRPPVNGGLPVDGVGLAWDIVSFPHMWLWLQNADPGFPWFGRARMVGLEPQRSWPFDGIVGAIERNQHLSLEPGESMSSWITLALFESDGRPVAGVDRSGRVRLES